MIELDPSKLRPGPARVTRKATRTQAAEALPLEDLLSLAQAGDGQAYAQLLRRVTPVLRQVARNRGVPPVDLDDVVQETLLALHRCRANYDPSRAFLPWLIGIAQHCARDRRRRNMREDRRMQAVRTLHQAWGSAGADDVVSGGLLAASLAAQIATLPPAQREAIEIVAIGEMDLRAAAEATGRSVGALKVNLHRARVPLHQRLAASGDIMPAPRNRSRRCLEQASQGD